MLITIRPGWNSSFLSAGRFLNKALYIFWPIVKIYIIQYNIRHYYMDKPQGLNCYPITDLIKTITKLSNVIGLYQQPDLSINWTVAHIMLVIGQYATFFARFCCALVQ